jgi:deoxyadenosine/deoxycytidine kinase
MSSFKVLIIEEVDANTLITLFYKNCQSYTTHTMAY